MQPTDEAVTGMSIKRGKKKQVESIAIRQPPFNREAEARLLAAMTLDNSIIGEVLIDTTEDSFWLENHKTIFNAVAKVFSRDGSVTPITLEDAVGSALGGLGGLEYVRAIVQGTDPKQWASWLSVVKRNARSRAYISLAKQIEEAVYEEKGDEEIYSIADKIKLKTPGEDGRAADVMSGEAVVQMADARKQGMDMEFGWGELDRRVGGIRRKLLYTIGAKTSHGKTTVGVNLVAHNLKKGKKVLMSVLENQDQIPYRLAAISANLSLDGFLKPEQLDEESYERYIKAVKELDQYKDQLILVGATPMAVLKSMAEKLHPDIIVLDYIQKYSYRFGGSGEKATVAREVGKAISDLQDIGIETNCATIALSQIKREYTPVGGGKSGKRPDISDLKESGDIENQSDVVLIPFWPWRDSLSDKIDPHIYNIMVAKNKLGECKDVQLSLNPQTLAITEWKDLSFKDYEDDGAWDGN